MTFGYPIRHKIHLLVHLRYCNMDSGIYKIVNNINKKVYIGSSKNIRHRWAVHLHELKNNKHHSIRLQRSFNKYGVDSFEFVVIEYCELDKLLQLEVDYINEYNSCLPENGYNMVENVSNPMFGRKHTEQAKEKMMGRIPWNKGLKNPYSDENLKVRSVKMSNLPRSREWCLKIGNSVRGGKNGFAKKVEILLDNTWVRYDSIADVSREYGICSSLIVRVCKGKNKTAGGYRFRYFDEKINQTKCKI